VLASLREGALVSRQHENDEGKPVTDIPATYGELKFGGSREFRRQFKLPKKGWYAWPSDINSLEAAMCGALFGPFADEEEAKEFADSKCFERVT
jgi:hypothetical protein